MTEERKYWKTGIRELDELLFDGKGFRSGKGYVISGPSQSGKTVLAICFSSNMIAQGAAITYMSIGRPAKDLVEMYLSFGVEVEGFLENKDLMILDWATIRSGGNPERTKAELGKLISGQAVDSIRFGRDPCDKKEFLDLITEVHKEKTAFHGKPGVGIIDAISDQVVLLGRRGLPGSIVSDIYFTARQRFSMEEPGVAFHLFAPLEERANSEYANLLNDLHLNHDGTIDLQYDIDETGEIVSRRMWVRSLHAGRAPAKKLGFQIHPKEPIRITGLASKPASGQEKHHAKSEKGPVQRSECPLEMHESALLWLQENPSVDLNRYKVVGEFVIADEGRRTSLLQQVSEIKRRFRHPNRKRPLSILLFGAPGSGKSFFAAEMSRELGLEYRRSNLADCRDLGKWLDKFFLEIKDLGEGQGVLLDEFDTELDGGANTIHRHLLDPLDLGKAKLLESGVQITLPKFLWFATGSKANTEVEYRRYLAEKDIERGPDCLRRFDKRIQFSMSKKACDISAMVCSIARSKLPNLKHIHAMILYYFCVAEWEDCGRIQRAVEAICERADDGFLGIELVPEAIELRAQDQELANSLGQRVIHLP